MPYCCTSCQISQRPIVLNSTQDENDIGGGLASAQIKWRYYGKNIPLQFNAGFIGATQDQKTLQISPSVGWYITVNKGDKKKGRRGMFGLFK